MSRVLVTGGAGTIGAAVVKRLLRDPDFECRVSDQRVAPVWMREGCEVHTGDLRVLDEARKAMRGCTHVIHLAAIVGGIANFHKLPHTLTEVNNALYNAVFRAALDEDVERFTYVSSSMVFEQAQSFPTREDYLPDCPTPVSAYGFSKLTGEVYCRAAHAEHGLRFTICRPFDPYGPAEPSEVLRAAAAEPGGWTRTPTHVDDVADGIVVAMASEAGLGEDFNLAAGEELSLAEIAALCDDLGSLEPPNDRARRRAPSVEKARRLLGWKARVAARDGLPATAAALRDRAAVAEPG